MLMERITFGDYREKNFVVLLIYSFVFYHHRGFKDSLADCYEANLFI